jgi:hypothetical protein
MKMRSHSGSHHVHVERGEVVLGGREVAKTLDYVDPTALHQRLPLNFNTHTQHSLYTTCMQCLDQLTGIFGPGQVVTEWYVHIHRGVSAGKGETIS